MEWIHVLTVDFISIRVLCVFRILFLTLLSKKKFFVFIFNSFSLLCSPSLKVCRWYNYPLEVQCHNDGSELLTHSDTQNVTHPIPGWQMGSLVQSLVARLFFASFRTLDQSTLYVTVPENNLQPLTSASFSEWRVTAQPTFNH